MSGIIISSLPVPFGKLKSAKSTKCLNTIRSTRYKIKESIFRALPGADQRSPEANIHKQADKAMPSCHSCFCPPPPPPPAASDYGGSAMIKIMRRSKRIKDMSLLTPLQSLYMKGECPHHIFRLVPSPWLYASTILYQSAAAKLRLFPLWGK